MIAGRGNLARIVAALLAMAVPLCCCPASALVRLVTTASVGTAQTAPASCCEHGDPAGDGQHPSSPCDDGPANERGAGCTCVKAKAPPGEQPAIDHGSLAGIPGLAAETPEAIGIARAAPCVSSRMAVYRPQTTLLCLHCALTV